MTLALLLALVTLLALCSAEVVVLDSKNFEHLTQASTGATSGDWLIKFYAPWCGHCKTLAPIYEEVAEKLAGQVNVAKVDVIQSRDLGTRFDIKGFPTLKLMSKGKVYTFKGRRSAEEIAEWATTGFQINEPEDVPPEMGMFGEITHVFRHAYKQAAKDISNKNYFTVDVFLMCLPVLFVLAMVLVFMIPAPGPEHERERVPRAGAAGESTRAAPSSAADAATNDDKTD